MLLVFVLPIRQMWKQHFCMRMQKVLVVVLLPPMWLSVTLQYCIRLILNNIRTEGVAFGVRHFLDNKSDVEPKTDDSDAEESVITPTRPHWRPTKRSSEPISEIRNETGLCGAFPHVFMFGQAHGKGPGSLTDREVYHLLHQFTQKYRQVVPSCKVISLIPPSVERPILQWQIR
jgi:hypothetical protein